MFWGRMVTVRGVFASVNFTRKLAFTRRPLGSSFLRPLSASKRSFARRISISPWGPPQRICTSFSVMVSMPSTSLQMSASAPSSCKGASVYLAVFGNRFGSPKSSSPNSSR